MPATARVKANAAKRISDTPYKRDSKSIKGDKQALDDQVALQQAVAQQDKPGYTKILIDWAKHLFYRPSDRGTLSQLEDGTLHKTDGAPSSNLGIGAGPRRPPGRAASGSIPAQRAVSLTQNDLQPHYLGKTPVSLKDQRAKAAREQSLRETEPEPPRYQVARFNSGQFKIPQLPSPMPDRTRTGPGMQQQETLHVSGLHLSHAPQQQETQESHPWSSQDTARPRKTTTSTATTLDPTRWNFGSANGIMAACRQISSLQQRQEQQAAFSHAASDNVQSSTRRHRRSFSHSGSVIMKDSSAENPQWHGELSFSQETEVDFPARPTLSVEEREAHAAAAQRSNNRYWAATQPLPHSTAPSGSGRTQDDQQDLQQILNDAAESPNNTRRRRQSRRPSRRVSRQARSSSRHSPEDAHRKPMPNGTSSRAPSVQPRASRAGTPKSVASTTRGAPRSRGHSTVPAPSLQLVRPSMIDSQVQTETADLDMLDPIFRIPTPPTLTKERRKRAGCFSALDEDMEDRFGPYTDVPAKRPKLTQDEAAELLLERPKVPLLREEEDVVQLRLQQQREAEREQEQACQKPVSAVNGSNPAAEKSNATSMPSFAFEQSADKPATSAAQGTMPVFGSSKAFGDNASAPVAPSSAPSFAFKVPEKPSAKPAESQEKTTTAMPNFNFSPIKPADSTPVPQAPGFSFKAPSTNVAAEKTEAAPASMFNFGGAAPAPPAAGATNTPSFSFGTTTTSKPDASSAEPSGKTGFSFGGLGNKPASDSTEASKDTNSAPKPGPTFSFGSTGASSQPASGTAPTFSFSGAAKPAAAAASSSFSFGSSATQQPAATNGTTNQSADTVKTDKPTSTGFNFGATPALPAASTTSAFSFGASAKVPTALTEPATGSAPGAFSIASITEPSTKTADKPANVFGAPTQASVPSTSMFGSTTTQPTTGFSFGTTQPAASTKAPAFGSETKPDTSAATATSRPDTAVITRDSTPGFSFGAPTDAAAKQATGSFGQQAPGSSGSLFGNTATQPGTTTTQSGAFGGSSASNAFGSTTAATEPSKSIFGGGSTAPAFGAQPASESSKPAFGASNATTNAFGSTQPTAEPGKVAFGGFGSTQPATSGFSFGGAQQQPSQTNTAPGSSQSNTAFNFGQTNAAAAAVPATTTAPTFQFGASNSTQTTAPTSGFTFGSNATQPSQALQQPSTAAPFAFGQSQAQPAAAAPAMVFGGSSQGFGAVGGTSTAPGSGFPSAAASPVLTAPNSPNPFAFNMGAAGTAPAGANGRKIAQPRTRRKK